MGAEVFSYPIDTVVLLSTDKGLWMCERIGCSTWNNTWASAGGATEGNELPIEAAIRETLEESGLVIDKHRLIYLGGEYHDHPKGGQQLCYFYRVVLAANEIPMRVEPQKHGEWELVPWVVVGERKKPSGYCGPLMNNYLSCYLEGEGW